MPPGRSPRDPQSPLPDMPRVRVQNLGIHHSTWAAFFTGALVAMVSTLLVVGLNADPANSAGEDPHMGEEIVRQDAVDYLLPVHSKGMIKVQLVNPDPFVYVTNWPRGCENCFHTGYWEYGNTCQVDPFTDLIPVGEMGNSVLLQVVRTYDDRPHFDRTCPVSGIFSVTRASYFKAKRRALLDLKTQQVRDAYKQDVREAIGQGTPI